MGRGVKLLHANSGQERRSGRGGRQRDDVAIAKALRMSLNLRTAESRHGISGWGATATANKLKCFDCGEGITTAVSLRDISEIWCGEILQLFKLRHSGEEHMLLLSLLF